MNKQQKEVLQAQLNNEELTIKELKKTYEQALNDCELRIRQLSARTDMENLQTIIYQKQYQEAIKAQLEGVLEQLHSNEFATVSDYLTTCYQEGYIGTMYDIAGQGMPIIIPMDQEQIVKAIQTDSKLSKTLYDSLGEDIKALKKSIRSEISRGIASGSTWNDVAVNMAVQFKNTPFNKAYNRCITIARTEGHRIQCAAQLDAQKVAKDKGCEVVKQWDSTLDGSTRDTHRKLDGQIREVNDDFEVDGMTASAPGMFGDPSEDCNCRCQLLQRAKWALGEDELETLKGRADYFGLDKADDFADFKEKYLNISEEELKKADESGIINIEEIKAIHDYMSAKSYIVNEKLRNGESLTENEQAFVNNLNKALDKMPKYEGNLQRSLYFSDNESVEEFVNMHEVGKPIAYNEFISTTKGETYNPDGQVQIYIQDSKNGCDISSINESELEVLYKTGSLFNVLNKVNVGGVYHILLGEL